MKVIQQRTLFTLGGMAAGTAAPIGWIFSAVVFFRPENVGIATYLSDFFSRTYDVALIAYMASTIIVLGGVGFFIGRAKDKLIAQNEDILRTKEATQKREQEYKATLDALGVKTSRLLDATRRIHEAGTVKKMFEEVARCAREILDFDRVTIFTIDESGETLSCVVSSGTGESTDKLSLPFDERAGVMFRAMTDNKAFVVRDISELPASMRIQQPYANFESLRAKSFFSIPFNKMGRSIGVMNVDNKIKKKVASEDDIGILTLLAQQVSAVLANYSFIESINRISIEMENTFSMILQQRDRQENLFRSFSEKIAEVNGGYARLNGNIRNLFQSLEKSAASITEIHASISNVSDSLKSLYSSTEDLASTAFEMNQLASEIASNTSDGLKSVVCLSDKADEGAQSIVNIYELIEGVKDTLEMSRNLFEKFRQTIRGVSQIVSTITTITEQTNLLSLNASIIASQAGEFGKPFSVVANEIKSLSEKTKYSAHEINNVIDALKNESQEVIITIEKTYDMVDKGISYAITSKRLYEELKMGAEESRALNTTIEGAVSEQLKGITYVSRATEDVKSATSRISTAAEEQLKGSNQIMLANEDINSLAAESLRTADDEVANIKNITEMVQQMSSFVGVMFREIEQKNASLSRLLAELKQFSM